MILILAAIVFTTSLMVCFKLFVNFKVNTFHAVVIDYYTASATSYFFAEKNFNFRISDPWFQFSFGIGLLFLITFMAMSISAQKISVIKSIISSKMSLIIPITYAVIFIGEELTIVKIIALILAMAGVLLTVIKPADTQKKDAGSAKSLLMLGVVFIGSGLVDTSFKVIETYFYSNTPPQFVMMVCYGSAAIFGTLYFLLQWIKGKPKVELKSIFAGIILGVLNYFSFIFVLDALHTPSLPSLVVFPLVNVGVLLLSTLIAILFFRERLRTINYIGVILSIISIFILAYQSYVV